MMRSLWSGVSGLRMHQIGMDVEGNNIANVNTNGFKFSRVNYSTMFSQTMAIATRPQGELGGQNAMQIGLGVDANSTYRIHSQGSITRTQSNYDVAISGNGFFLVSNDGGDTKYLTRDGSFNVDAAGNFVNAAGYVVQGWNRDPITGRVDVSLPATNIKWDPAMQLPANPSSEIFLNASLNSSLKVTQDTVRALYSLDSVHNFNTRTATTQEENDSGVTQFFTTTNNNVDVTEKGVDFASVFDGDSYEGLGVREGQGIWVSFADATYTTNKGGQGVFDINSAATQNSVLFWGSGTTNVTLDIQLNGVNIQNANINSLDAAVAYINTFTAAQGDRAGTGVRAVKKADNSGIEFVNTNANGSTDAMKNINLIVNEANTAGELYNAVFANNAFTFTSQKQNNATTWTVDAPANPANPTAPAANNNTAAVITAHKYIYTASAVNLAPMFNPDGGPAYETAQGNVNNPTWTNTPAGIASANYYQAAINGNLLNSNDRIFHSTEDLRELLQRDARYGVDYNGSGSFSAEDINEKVRVTVNSTGNYVISNLNETTVLGGGAAQLVTGVANPTIANPLQAKNMNFQITTYQDQAGTISTNSAFANIFQGWQGALPTGTQNRLTKDLALSHFGTSLQIFDSLGTEHLIQVQWTKHTTTIDGGNEWQMLLKVPEPATINTTGVGPNNVVVGTVRFGNDGSLISFEPRSINFSANNGSAPNQQISLNLGSGGGFNGLVSNNQPSAIAKQQTDGFKPGNLRQGQENVRIDQNGNILGSFDNGITLVLARIAMGNVTNDAGLEDMGGNLFRNSANSGDVTIGTAGTGGRGSMQTSALEASNADLSTSLTNLIIVQRGYQANSKTITTSDQMLNTLLQLKQ